MIAWIVHLANTVWLQVLSVSRAVVCFVHQALIRAAQDLLLQPHVFHVKLASTAPLWVPPIPLHASCVIKASFLPLWEPIVPQLASIVPLAPTIQPEEPTLHGFVYLVDSKSTAQQDLLKPRSVWHVQWEPSEMDLPALMWMGVRMILVIKE